MGKIPQNFVDLLLRSMWLWLLRMSAAALKLQQAFFSVASYGENGKLSEPTPSLLNAAVCLSFTGMIEKSDGTLGRSRTGGNNRRNVVVVEDDQQPQVKSGGCCG